MAQPLLARLRGKRGTSRIDVLAPPWVAPVLKRMTEVDEVIQADLSHGALQLRERWRLGRRLKERGYDQAIVLPNSWKSALAPFFADIPVRSGYVGEFRYGLLNLNYGDNDPGAMAAHYARLSEPPGDEAAGPLAEPRLRISAGEVEATKTSSRLAGATPFSAPAPSTARPSAGPISRSSRPGWALRLYCWGLPPRRRRRIPSKGKT